MSNGIDMRYLGFPRLSGSLLVFIVIGLFLSVSRGDCSISAPLPLNSWIYPSLEKLGGFGLLDSALVGTRPWSRLEAARLTAEARDQAQGAYLPPLAGRLLHRLETEFGEEMADLGTGRDAVLRSYYKPVRELDFAYFYRDGEDSLFPGTDARQFALNYNNDGVDYDEHNSSQLLLTTEASFGGVLLLSARPLLAYHEGDDRAVSLRLFQGEVALALGPVEISAGRQSLWWGQGRHGALVLSNNARPLDMVRVTNPSPLLLPWAFRYLGPFRFDFFLSRLEKERHVPEPYFGGLRLTVKPLPWLELGASRTAMYGGEGRPDVDFVDLLTILGGGNQSGSGDTSNSVAALDAKMSFPAAGGAEFYGELGGEDEAGGFISNKAFLAGLCLRRPDPRGIARLRFEYADLSHIDKNSPAWYRHEIYRSGFTYKEKILGHHVGGAGEDFFTEIELLLRADLSLRLGFDYEKRGIDQMVPEHHRQPSAMLTWQPTPGFSMVSSYAYDRISNVGFVAGRNRESHLARFILRGAW